MASELLKQINNKQESAVDVDAKSSNISKHKTSDSEKSIVDKRTSNSSINAYDTNNQELENNFSSKVRRVNSPKMRRV